MDFAGGLCPAIALLRSLTLPTSAETIAETAKQWGLIGSRSLDCSLPPDHAKGTVLIYEANGEARQVHRQRQADTGPAQVRAAAGVSWTSPPLAHGPRAKTWLAPQGARP